MNRDQLIRALRKESKKRGLPFSVDKKLGKGAHYRVDFGDKRTTLKSGELSPAYVRMIRKQLGLE